MITLNYFEWEKLRTGFNDNPRASMTEVVSLLGASTYHMPRSDIPWIIFMFDDPKQETFARLKYL